MDTDERPELGEREGALPLIVLPLDPPLSRATDDGHDRNGREAEGALPLIVLPLAAFLVTAYGLWLWPQAAAVWRESIAPLGPSDLFSTLASTVTTLGLVGEIAFGGLAIQLATQARFDAKAVSFIWLVIFTIIGEILTAITAGPLTLIIGLLIILVSLGLIYAAMINTWPGMLPLLRWQVCTIWWPMLLPWFEKIVKDYLDCVKWGSETAIHQLEICLQWNIRAVKQCVRETQRRRRVCQRWSTVTTATCPGGFVGWLCRGLVWVVEKVCVLATWIVEVICLVWAVIVVAVCILWSLIVWVIVVVVCLLYALLRLVIFLLAGFILVLLRLLALC